MWPADGLLSLVSDSLARRGPRLALEHLLAGLQAADPDQAFAVLLRWGTQGFLAVSGGDTDTRSLFATAALQTQLLRFPGQSIDPQPLRLPPASERAVHAGAWQSLPIDVEGESLGFLLVPHADGGVFAAWQAALRLVLQHFQLLDLSGTRDYLTGLHSRRHLDAMLRRALVVHNRHRQPFAFGLLDIDHFKDINDALGHAAGDEVLREIGKRLESSSRLSDTVARYGGDEFGVLLQHLPLADADGTIRRLHGQLDAFDVRIPSLAGIPVIPRVSGGWIHVGAADPTPDMEALVAAADRLLYLAKDDPDTPWRRESHSPNA
jgi:diguanylate cyclase (GGDEF)-like protein